MDLESLLERMRRHYRRALELSAEPGGVLLNAELARTAVKLARTAEEVDRQLLTPPAAGPEVGAVPAEEQP